MSSQGGCRVCAYVASQLGPNTPCFVHVGRRYFSAAADEASLLSTPYPTLEQPGVFTLREYGRLLVLRSRYQERRWLDQAS